MDHFQGYELRLVNHQTNEYEIVIHLADQLSEFANELGTIERERKDIIGLAKQIINERYPHIKVTMVKVLIGGIAVTSLSLVGEYEASAQSANNTAITTSASQDSNIYYSISSGDSLWNISKKFNTNIDLIKKANNLLSDILHLNQRLVIPKALHTVGSGDYLTVLAKKYGTTVNAIKQANALTSENTRLGQVLIIPVLIDEYSTTPPTAIGPSSESVTQSRTYTIVAGDTLSAISKQFGITVEALKSENKLTSDLLRVGQTLNIPTNTIDTIGKEQVTKEYIVVAGDSLSVIAKRFDTTTDALKNTNNLTSNLLKIGQVLTIPGGNSTTAPTSSDSHQEIVPTTEIRYTVVAGDSLSVIAKRFDTTTDALKNTNNLTSNLLKIGQVLTIPGENSTTAPTPSDSHQEIVPSTEIRYTVVAGDSLSVIAKRFDTTVDVIKYANNLTSDLLRIGQSLTIPGENSTTALTPPDSNQEKVPTTEIRYTVVAGDTLWLIANRYKTEVNALRSANNLTSDVLTIGQVLTIPSNEHTNVTQPPTSTESAQEQMQEERSTFIYSVKFGDSLSVIAKQFDVTIESIQSTNKLNSDFLQVGQALTIPNGINAPKQTVTNSISYTTHTVVSGDNIWDLSIRYGIPQSELLRANNLTISSMLSINQKLTIPVHIISVKPVVSEKHGEYLDWWTEGQYVFPISKTAKVTDFDTGNSFYIKRTIGANHADSETVSVNDSNIAKSIWGGFSWIPRAVILEIDGRKIAASMSFMPHEQDYIANNGISGHFDVYLGNSIRHADGKPDASHQLQVERAAGIR